MVQSASQAARHRAATEPAELVFVPKVVFSVYGLPIAQGSKRAMNHWVTGRAIMLDTKSATLIPWRKKIKQAALSAMGSPMMLTGPVSVRFDFTMRKPTGRPKTRRTYPDVYPDLDKLVRATGDALTMAQVYGDDGQIVDLYATKSYPGETPWALSEPGVCVTVRALQGWTQG